MSCGYVNSNESNDRRTQFMNFKLLASCEWDSPWGSSNLGFCACAQALQGAVFGNFWAKVRKCSGSAHHKQSWGKKVDRWVYFKGVLQFYSHWASILCGFYELNLSVFFRDFFCCGRLPIWLAGPKRISLEAQASARYNVEINCAA